jgi:hypothetical protein
MKIEVNRKQAMILWYILNNVQNRTSSQALQQEGVYILLKSDKRYTEHLEKWLEETGKEFMQIQNIKEQIGEYIESENKDTKSTE